MFFPNNKNHAEKNKKKKEKNGKKTTTHSNISLPIILVTLGVFPQKTCRKKKKNKQKITPTSVYYLSRFFPNYKLLEFFVFFFFFSFSFSVMFYHTERKKQKQKHTQKLQ